MANYSVFDIDEEDYYIPLYHDEEESNPYAHYIAQHLALEAYVNEFNSSLLRTYGMSFLDPKDYLIIPEGMFAIEDIQPHMRECQNRIESKFRTQELREQEINPRSTQNSVRSNESSLDVPYFVSDSNELSRDVHLDEKEEPLHLIVTLMDNSAHVPSNKTSATNEDESNFSSHTVYFTDHICSQEIAKLECKMVTLSEDYCCYFLHGICETYLDTIVYSDSNGNTVANENNELISSQSAFGISSCITITEKVFAPRYLCNDPLYVENNPTSRKYSLGKKPVAIVLQHKISTPDPNICINSCVASCNTVPVFFDSTESSVPETSNNFVINNKYQDKRRYASSAFIPKYYTPFNHSKRTDPKWDRYIKKIRKSASYSSAVNAENPHSSRVTMVEHKTDHFQMETGRSPKVNSPKTRNCLPIGPFCARGKSTVLENVKGKRLYNFVSAVSDTSIHIPSSSPLVWT